MKWQAIIYHGSKKVSIGLHATPVQAARVRRDTMAAGIEAFLEEKNVSLYSRKPGANARPHHVEEKLLSDLSVGDDDDILASDELLEYTEPGVYEDVLPVKDDERHKASINVDGEKLVIGTFATAIEAAGPPSTTIHPTVMSSLSTPEPCMQCLRPSLKAKHTCNRGRKRKLMPTTPTTPYDNLTASADGGRACFKAQQQLESDDLLVPDGDRSSDEDYTEEEDNDDAALLQQGYSAEKSEEDLGDATREGAAGDSPTTGRGGAPSAWWLGVTASASPSWSMQVYEERLRQLSFMPIHPKHLHQYGSLSGAGSIARPSPVKSAAPRLPVPSGVTVHDIHETGLSLSWVFKPADSVNVSWLLQYRSYDQRISEADGTNGWCFKVPSSVTTTTNTGKMVVHGLVSGRSYEFRVQAKAEQLDGSTTKSNRAVSASSGKVQLTKPRDTEHPWQTLMLSRQRFSAAPTASVQLQSSTEQDRPTPVDVIKPAEGGPGKAVERFYSALLKGGFPTRKAHTVATSLVSAGIAQAKKAPESLFTVMLSQLDAAVPQLRDRSVTVAKFAEQCQQLSSIPPPISSTAADVSKLWNDAVLPPETVLDGTKPHIVECLRKLSRPDRISAAPTVSASSAPPTTVDSILAGLKSIPEEAKARLREAREAQEASEVAPKRNTEPRLSSSRLSPAADVEGQPAPTPMLVQEGLPPAIPAEAEAAAAVLFEEIAPPPPPPPLSHGPPPPSALPTELPHDVPAKKCTSAGAADALSCSMQREGACAAPTELLAPPQLVVEDGAPGARGTWGKRSPRESGDGWGVLFPDSMHDGSHEDLFSGAQHYCGVRTAFMKTFSQERNITVESGLLRGGQDAASTPSLPAAIQRTTSEKIFGVGTTPESSLVHKIESYLETISEREEPTVHSVEPGVLLSPPGSVTRPTAGVASEGASEVAVIGALAKQRLRGRGVRFADDEGHELCQYHDAASGESFRTVTKKEIPERVSVRVGQPQQQSRGLPTAVNAAIPDSEDVLKKTLYVVHPALTVDNQDAFTSLFEEFSGPPSFGNTAQVEFTLLNGGGHGFVKYQRLADAALAAERLPRYLGGQTSSASLARHLKNIPIRVTRQRPEPCSPNYSGQCLLSEAACGKRHMADERRTKKQKHSGTQQSTPSDAGSQPRRPIWKRLGVPNSSAARDSHPTHSNASNGSATPSTAAGRMIVHQLSSNNTSKKRSRSSDHFDHSAKRHCGARQSRLESREENRKEADVWYSSRKQGSRS